MAKKQMSPPTTDDAMENKLVALALDQARVQLQEGTASSQIITHFLKLGSLRHSIELEKLELENRLLEEKILAEQTGQQINEMMAEVMAALKSYTYVPPGEL
jgi:hypothetical protein